VKAAADGFTATVTVTNTGKSAGKEVVQLYVTAPDGGLVKPAYELKEFAKTKELQPGESQTVTMTVSNYDLASFNTAASAWESPAGTYKVHFASSVEDIRLTSEYKIKKNNTWKTNDVLHPENEVKEISVVR
jgi:beta-glucosidase